MPANSGSTFPERDVYGLRVTTDNESVATFLMQSARDDKNQPVLNLTDCTLIASRQRLIDDEWRYVMARPRPGLNPKPIKTEIFEGMSGTAHDIGRIVFTKDTATQVPDELELKDVTITTTYPVDPREMPESFQAFANAEEIQLPMPANISFQGKTLKLDREVPDTFIGQISLAQVPLQ